MISTVSPSPSPSLLQSLVGRSVLDRFEFSKAPFTSLSTVLIGIFLYLTTIGALKFAIRRRGKGFNLTLFSSIYNAGLSLMSLVLFSLIVSELRHILATSSVWELICDPGAKLTVGRHVFLYYLVYHTKYFELTDTILLCLRNKSTPFIHVYHHAVTILFAWMHLNARTCVAFVLTTMNLFVHIILYAYFAILEWRQYQYEVASKSNRSGAVIPRPADIWWKRYLTAIQVSQFYLIFIPAFAVLIPRAIWEFSPNSSLAAECTGTWPGTVIGIVILLSYLALFQNLYKEKYKSNKVINNEKYAAKSGGAASTNASAADGKLVQRALVELAGKMQLVESGSDGDLSHYSHLQGSAAMASASIWGANWDEKRHPKWQNAKFLEIQEKQKKIDERILKERRGAGANNKLMTIEEKFELEMSENNSGRQKKAEIEEVQHRIPHQSDSNPDSNPAATASVNHQAATATATATSTSETKNRKNKKSKSVKETAAEQDKEKKGNKKSE